MACWTAGSSPAAPGLVRFRRGDYLGDPPSGWQDAVRALVERRTGRAPAGPIRLLTQLRTFGHCFNPVSFYYCFTPQEQLDAVVAEVTSTPWGERHAYVLQRTAKARCWPPASRRRCMYPRSWGWSSATPCARPRPARPWRFTSRATSVERRALTRRSRCVARR